MTQRTLLTNFLNYLKEEMPGYKLRHINTFNAVNRFLATLPQKKEAVLIFDAAMIFGIKTESLFLSRGKQIVSTCRNAIIYRLIKEGYSKDMAAGVFKKHRTTVYNSIKAINRIIETKDKLYFPLVMRVIGEVEE